MTERGENIRAVLLIGMLMVMFYIGIASAVFRWRNPTANDAACWREMGAVLRWQ